MVELTLGESMECSRLLVVGRRPLFLDEGNADKRVKEHVGLHNFLHSPICTPLPLFGFDPGSCKQTIYHQKGSRMDICNHTFQVQLPEDEQKDFLYIYKIWNSHLCLGRILAQGTAFRYLSLHLRHEIYKNKK